LQRRAEQVDAAQAHGVGEEVEVAGGGRGLVEVVLEGSTELAGLLDDRRPALLGHGQQLMVQLHRVTPPLRLSSTRYRPDTLAVPRVQSRSTYSPSPGTSTSTGSLNCDSVVVPDPDSSSS